MTSPSPAELVKRLRKPFQNKLSDFPYDRGYDLFADIKKIWGKERKQAASMIEALVKERDEAIEEKNRGEI